jgi:hypothetical protein
MRFVKSVCIVLLAAGCQTSTAPEPQPEVPRIDIPMLPGENIDQLFSRIAGAVPGFGGFFLENGRLVCWLTDTQDSDRLNAYFRSLGATSLCQEVRQGQFDFNQLQAWRALLRDAGIYQLGLCTDDNQEKLNRIVYGVINSNAYNRVLDLVRASGVPVAAVIVEIGPCPTLLT